MKREASFWRKIKDKKMFYYRSDLWARVLANFAIAYRDQEIAREELIESMIVPNTTEVDSPDGMYF